MKKLIAILLLAFSAIASAATVECLATQTYMLYSGKLEATYKSFSTLVLPVTYEQLEASEGLGDFEIFATVESQGYTWSIDTGADGLLGVTGIYNYKAGVADAGPVTVMILSTFCYIEI